MACNCGHHHHNHNEYPRHCNHIGRAFDPNPPSFYGTWNNTHRFNITNRVSLTQPGITTGLYCNGGPLTCTQCGNVTALTNVSTTSRIILTINFQYTNKALNSSIDIIPGNIYTIEYVEDGDLRRCTGMVVDIYEVTQVTSDNTLYKIKVDCSTSYSNNIVVIKTDQIRGLREFIEYAEEDKTINNAYHQYGTTIAEVIEDAVIIDAELDANKNIIKGTIVDGTMDKARTVDGLVSGTNSNGHEIVLKNTATKG